MNKGYINNNPSYFNKYFVNCSQTTEAPKEILPIKADLCNTADDKECYNRSALPLGYYFDIYKTPVLYIYSSTTQMYQNNIPYKTIAFMPYGAYPYSSLPATKYLLYKIEKIENDNSYDYKITDLRTDEMVGFDYKVINDIEMVLYENDKCSIKKYDYIIINKGFINNYNIMDTDGCYYYINYLDSNDYP